VIADTKKPTGASEHLPALDGLRGLALLRLASPMAPPFTFSLAGSSSSSRDSATICDAKASLISNRSTLPALHPIFSSRRRIAVTGVINTCRGSRPLVA